MPRLSRAVPPHARGLDVVHRLHPFGEAQLHTAQLGQPPEDLEIVQRIALRRDDLLHRIELVDVVGAARGNVVALHRRGGGQNDVRPARGSRPPALCNQNLRLQADLKARFVIYFGYSASGCRVIPVRG